MVTSVVCLSVFLLGSIHHLLETAIRVARFVFSSIKKQLNCLKIKPVKESNPTSLSKSKDLSKASTKVKYSDKTSKRIKFKDPENVVPNKRLEIDEHI
jgi:hypothetical protein